MCVRACVCAGVCLFFLSFFLLQPVTADVVILFAATEYAINIALPQHLRPDLCYSKEKEKAVVAE